MGWARHNSVGKHKIVNRKKNWQGISSNIVYLYKKYKTSATPKINIIMPKNIGQNRLISSLEYCDALQL